MSLMGQMMNMPLMISSLLKHAARHNGDVEIVSKRVEGDLHRTTWGEVELRSRKLAQALQRLGCQPGDRIGTLAWNGYRHLELYYGTSGAEFVCHTINPRLFPQQISWIVNDAKDSVLCVDLNLLPLVEKLIEHVPSVKAVIAMVGREHMPAQSGIPNLLCYEDLLAAEDGNYDWPVFDENTAASICYTSGTTGNPKGAVYSHRSTILHTYASAIPEAINLGATGVLMPVVPMFHVNAWGLPYAAPMVGAKLVMPGAARVVSWPEGNTPLVARDAVRAYAGVAVLHLKHEGMNPTGSFKDRGMTVAVSQAVRTGARAVACASTGNTAASLAAYGAAAGLKTLVFVPRGKVSTGKMAQSLAYGARTLLVDGDFDACLGLARAASRELGVYLANSVNPWRIEGQKTIAWELLQQLGWESPDWIALPAGA